jgi:hypothetical protein
MTNPKLTREYLLSDELKREMESLIERSEAAAAARDERADRRRRTLRRVSLGLLGR